MLNLFNIPEKCGDCSFIRMFNNMHVCGFPKSTQEESMLDVTAYKVSTDSRPIWCDMCKANDFYKSLSEEKQKAIKAIADSIPILFG